MLGVGGAAHAQALPSPTQFKAEHGGRIDLSGTRFTYDAKTDTFVARGNAVLKQGPSLLRAEILSFDRRNQIARAKGAVKLTDPQVDITASQARFDLRNETGELDNARVRTKPQGYLLEGSRLSKLPGQHYHISNGYFTSCGCETGTPSWSVRAKDLDITLGGEGVIRSGRFQILDHPVLYVPYASFPVGIDRRSGLLAPLLGQSRLRGFQYFQPYYLDINRSSDATVGLDIETSARVGGLAEYRLQNGPDDYLRATGGFFDESIRGNRNTDIIDNQIADPHVPIDRYGLIGVARQHLTPNLTAFGDGITVSDSLYLREMDLYTLSRGYGSNFSVMRTANSDFGLQQSFTNSYLRLSGTWIQDLIQPPQFTLQTLPQLLWSGRQNLGVGYAFADFDVSGANFYRGDGVDGTRFDIYPRVTVPWRWGDYLYAYASAGGRETVYDTSGHKINIIPVGTFDPALGTTLTYNNGLALGPLSQGGLQHREVGYLSAGASTVIDRVYDFDRFSIEKLKHTIEPLVRYDYVPVVDQASLPLFDSVDRIEPRSLFTYGLVSRLYAKMAPGASVGRQNDMPAVNAVSLDSADEGEPQPPAQQGDVRELAEFSLLQEYDTSHSLTVQGPHFSDILAGLVTFPNRYLWLGEYSDFNPNTRQFAGQNVFLVVRPPWAAAPRNRAFLGRAFIGGPYLQLNYLFIGGRTGVQQISGRLYYEFFKRLGIYYEPSYDLADGRMLYTEYGVRLKSKCDCWVLDVGVNNSINPSEVQVFVQLTLGGIGSIGRNPFGQNLLMSNPYGVNRGPWQ